MLQSLRINLFSGLKHAMTSLLLESNNLTQFFAYTDTQEQFSISKPDPRNFEQMLNKAKVIPAEPIMAGDRIDKDIIPAKQIGMKTVRIRIG